MTYKHGTPRNFYQYLLNDSGTNNNFCSTHQHKCLCVGGQLHSDVRGDGVEQSSSTSDDV